MRGCTQCVAAYRVWLNAAWFTWNWSAFDLVHRGSPWFTAPFSPVQSRCPSARSTKNLMWQIDEGAWCLRKPLMRCTQVLRGTS